MSCFERLRGWRRYPQAAAAAWVAVLWTGCGLNPGSLSTPAVPKQPGGLRAAPGWVMDRMAQVAPDLYFDFNSHVIRRPEKRQFAKIAAGLEGILHDFPDLIVVIEGHCDDRGLTEYNRQLGGERANAVKGALLNLGFPEACLRTVSLSHRAPLCLTPDDQCRQKNRRVHFRAAQLMSTAEGEE